MGKTDKVYSFIIPHHNCPNLLYRLLDTIPQRNDIEIIVVDDNSDADKVPVITRSDVQLILIPASESKGAGHARNVGLDHATGKWLLFADSDDYYDTQLLSCLDRYKNCDADILFFSAYTDVKVGQPISKDPNGFDKNIQLYESSQHAIKDIQRLGLSSNVPWNKMFRHDFITCIDARFEEIPISNDAWFVNYAGSEARRIIAIPVKLYYYVANDSGITNKKRPLSHHYYSLFSFIKRNKLKAKYDLWDLMRLGIARKKLLVEHYGKYEYYKYYFVWITHDYTYWILLIKKINKYAYRLYNRCLRYVSYRSPKHFA